MTIAHYLTFFRILMSPVFLIVYIWHESLGLSSITLPYALLAILTVCELTDAFDGYVARRYNQVTDLGKLIDPMADSINRLSVFLTFTQKPVEIPMLLVFLFLYRDSIISTLRTVCALRGVALAARASGKIKAIVQAIAAFLIVLLMIPHSLGLVSTQYLQDSSTIIVGIAAAYSLASGGEYILANWKFLSKLFTRRSAELL